MYAAMGFESLTTGMGTGAFSVLLLRMTQKRFSATQYALFSSLFALPRLLAGPVTGVMVDAIGWRDFFLFTMAVGVPGMLMLHRFSPLGTREPAIAGEAPPVKRALGRGALIGRAVAGGIVGFAVGATATAGLTAMKVLHKDPGRSFDFVTPLAALLAPDTMSAWTRLVGVALFGLVIALATAATAAARSGTPRGNRPP
jgi:PAT family beta-lactamase induction signal transducer AmpG